MSGKCKPAGVDQVVNGVVIHKDFHSSAPDLKKGEDQNGCATAVAADDHLMRPALSQENVNKSQVADDAFKSMTTSLDERIGSQRGYFTLPSRNKRMVIDPEGNYRAVSKIRPVKITGTAPPPPEHPPPPPPVGGEVVVSPGGTVRSSFKPTDTAKLYALPETSASVAFRGKQDGESDKKQRSPTARANSMPPKPSRPQVLRREVVPAAPPPPPQQAGVVTETYSVNGVNYTTYTTFRSPITPDEVDAPSFSNRAMFPDGSSHHPVIPEPDYDSEPRSKTLERSKKKKSVSFVDEVSASIRPSSINKMSRGQHNQQDSILKDPNRDRSILCNPFANNPEKYTQPIDRIPTAKLKPPPQPAAVNPEPAKIRIEVPPVVPCKLNRSNSTAGVETSHSNGHQQNSQAKVSLQKSLSFCADKSSSSGQVAAAAAAAAAVKLNISGSSTPQQQQQPSSHGVMHPTENEILRVRSQLKPSRSFPNELKQQEAETDNSSSGVSSDHENQAAK